jgi:hypothetical protein
MDASSRDQALGMAVSRAAFFLAVVIPLNVAVVCWITGLRLRAFVPWLPGPFLAAGAALASVLLLELSGLLEGVGNFVGLLVAGTVSTLAAGGVLLALEPQARKFVRPLYRRLRGRETDTAPA